MQLQFLVDRAMRAAGDSRIPALLAALLALSAAQDRIVPLDTYTCQQKIYVHVDLKSVAPGKHRLEAMWRLPDGQLQETTKQEFKAPAKQAVLWIEAQKPPLFGAPPRWTGRWTVDIQLDSKKMGVLPFQMNC